MYLALTESSSTVFLIPWTRAEPVIHVTAVAGPPVEIQVRVNRGIGLLGTLSTVSDITSSVWSWPVAASEKEQRC